MSIEEARLRPDPPSALPRGTRLGEFELKHVLGVGGFGIVYLAFDHALEREVAVKEYMPASLVGRTETLHVSLRSQSDAETFALGLKSFVNEAKMLARFDHPSLLKVLRFWEANGTAYMAMPVLRGQTAKEARQAMAVPPTEAWLRALLDPLLGAIERLHAEGVYHRDIAPDNIQIEADGHPVLLDFGAARRVINDKTHTLTAILKPAYAPIEQYAEVGSVKQGPWTDLYAMGATLHFLLLGRPPLPSTARAVQDDLSPLASQALPGCSEAFLNVIDWMLAPRPADRPQSAAALREVLAGRSPPPRRRAAEPIVSDSQWDNTLIVAPPRAPATASPPAPPVSPHMAPQATPGLPAQRRAESAPAPARSHHDDAEQATIVMPAPGHTAAAFRAALADQAARAGAATPRAGASGSPAVQRRERSRWPLVLGIVLIVALVGGVALWSGAKGVNKTDQTLAAAPAAAEVAAPVEQVLPAAPPVVLSASPAGAEPAVLPAVSPAAPAAETPALAATPAPAAATRPAPRPVDKRPVALLPQTTTPSYTPPAPLNVQPVSAPPAADPGAAPAGKSSLQTSAEPVTDNNKAPISGPEARCAGRNAVSRFVCMERECLRAEFAIHADCKKWRSAAPPRE